MCWTSCVFGRSFRESVIVSQYLFHHCTLLHQNFKKYPTDFSDNANKTSILVIEWFYAEGLFVIPWPLIQIFDWHVRPRSRTQGGRPSRHYDRCDRGRLLWNNLSTRLSSGTVLIQKRSFFVSFRSFVVSLFQCACRAKIVNTSE